MHRSPRSMRSTFAQFELEFERVRRLPAGMPWPRHRSVAACTLLLVATLANDDGGGSGGAGTCSNATFNARSRARADDAPSVDEYYPHIEECGSDLRPATIADNGVPVVLRGAASSMAAVRPNTTTHHHTT